MSHWQLRELGSSSVIRYMAIIQLGISMDFIGFPIQFHKCSKKGGLYFELEIQLE